MSAIALGVASALGHVVARVLVTTLVLTLVGALALVGVLTLVSVLDIAFYVLDGVHHAAANVASLSADAPTTAAGL